MATAGKSGRSYDAATLTYTFVWQTDKAWANTCRELQGKLTDGAESRRPFVAVARTEEFIKVSMTPKQAAQFSAPGGSWRRIAIEEAMNQPMRT